MNTVIRDEIVTRLDRLPESRQREALELIRAMESVSVEGTPGGDLSSFAGTLSAEEAADMLRIIEDEFERVDADAW